MVYLPLLSIAQSSQLPSVELELEAWSLKQLLEKLELGAWSLVLWDFTSIFDFAQQSTHTHAADCEL